MNKHAFLCHLVDLYQEHGNYAHLTYLYRHRTHSLSCDPDGELGGRHILKGQCTLQEMVKFLVAKLTEIASDIIAKLQGDACKGEALFDYEWTLDEYEEWKKETLDDQFHVLSFINLHKDTK